MKKTLTLIKFRTKLEKPLGFLKKEKKKEKPLGKLPFLSMDASGSREPKRFLSPDMSKIVAPLSPRCVSFLAKVFRNKESDYL
jgi:hypothetical protein